MLIFSCLLVIFRLKSYFCIQVDSLFEKIVLVYGSCSYCQPKANQRGVIHRMFLLSFDVGLKMIQTNIEYYYYFLVKYSKNYQGKASTKFELKVV